jgi:hypothetical protein
VNGLNATPYQVVLTLGSGAIYSFPVAGGQEISASVPNNETYNVTIYYYVPGGSASCTAASLYVYSQLPVLAVDISC